MAIDSTTLYFAYWLQWVGDRTPGRRGSGVQMGGKPVTLTVAAKAEDLMAGGLSGSCELWAAESKFLDWVHRHHPSHSIVHWEARVAGAEGAKISEFRSGFTASE